MSRQFIKKALLYGTSIFVFINVIIAVRAYRFTHFKTIDNIIQPKTADFFGYIMQRFSGQAYYKIPLTKAPTVPFETIYVTSANDLKLQGWYMPIPNAKGTVIVYHGFGGNKERMLPEAYGLQKMGYNILLMDFRAHGNSEGIACTLGKDEGEDVKLAFEYIKNKGEQNIILYGASMGAASIASSLNQYDIKPSKVILDMPFANYKQLIEKFFGKSKYPIRPTSTLFTFWAGVFNNEWFFDMKPSNYVKSITCPVLLQWGRYDELVPEASNTLIYNNITAPKQLKIYEQSAHESYCTKEPEQWVSTVSTFLNN
jgi:uncharacterized protein